MAEMPGATGRWPRYHRRWCCIMPGEIDVGGLVRVIPVLGLTMGMTLRVRAADGCWKPI